MAIQKYENPGIISQDSDYVILDRAEYHDLKVQRSHFQALENRQELYSAARNQSPTFTELSRLCIVLVLSACTFVSCAQLAENRHRERVILYYGK